MPHKSTKPVLFSDQLKSWSTGKQPKTLDSLIANFGEKSFAVIIMLFMFLPALPIPTGGITHVLEIGTIILAVEQVVGLKEIWLPKFISKRINLQKIVQGKVMDSMLKRIMWLESKSNPRGNWILEAPLVNRLLGLIIIGFTIAAATAVPFSGLDTFPALGVVFIALAMLLEDAVLMFVGIVLGTAGVLLSIFLGAEIAHYLKHLLHKS
jgi:hypothetical protein